MKLFELPIDIRAKLEQERLELMSKQYNTSYAILLYNESGTRFFRAMRKSQPWNNDKGGYMPFGGGTYWEMSYGAVQFERYSNPLGERDYRWSHGKRFGKSQSGQAIPKRVNTKKEVLNIINGIGIFKL